jgi:hypothetical protein
MHGQPNIKTSKYLVEPQSFIKDKWFFDHLSFTSILPHGTSLRVIASLLINVR